MKYITNTELEKYNQAGFTFLTRNYGELSTVLEIQFKGSPRYRNTLTSGCVVEQCHTAIATLKGVVLDKGNAVKQPKNPIDLIVA